MQYFNHHDRPIPQTDAVITPRETIESTSKSNKPADRWITD